VTVPQGLPDVSVVIPTRDGWSNLPATVDRALEQEDVDVELIIVDDGSVDVTPDRLRSFNDPRVIVRRHRTSRGVAEARNTGIAAARGRWVAFLDHDDLWAPRKLRTQLDVAERQGADFIYSAAILVDSSGRSIRLLEAPPPEKLRYALAHAPVVPAGQSNVVARAEFIRQIGGFDPGLRTLADWEMWIRMAWAGTPALCDEIHVAYRVHEGTMTTRHANCERDIARMLNRYDAEHLDRRSANTFADRWRGYALRRTGRRLEASRQYLASAIRTRQAGMLVRALAVLGGERVMNLRSRRSAPQPTWLEPDRLSEVSRG
jgi:glycosyltransferase involved in cell wall biosynthesis